MLHEFWRHSADDVSVEPNAAAAGDASRRGVDLNEREAIVRHVALPALAPAAIVGLYFTPLSVIDCVQRGLLALAVVTASTLAALATAWFAARARRHAAQDPRPARWWLVSTLILLLPLALLVGPLG